MIHYRTIDGPIGPINPWRAWLGVERTCGCSSRRMKPKPHTLDTRPGAFSGAVDQLNAYFAGELTEFDGPRERLSAAVNIADNPITKPGPTGNRH